MNPVLNTQNLSIGYTAPRRPDVVVAQDINLTLHGGELVCLLGPNGAGKSTLLRTIAGMQPPLDGQIVLGGDDLATLQPRQLAARLSVVLTDRPNVGLLNGYALVALGLLPHLPAQAITFPQLYPTYSDVPVPARPSQTLERIEEIEQQHVRQHDRKENDHDLGEVKFPGMKNPLSGYFHQTT